MNFKLDFKPTKLIPHYIESKQVDHSKVIFETKKKFPDRFYHTSQVVIPHCPSHIKNSTKPETVKVKELR